LSSLISGRDVSIGADALARRFPGHIPASVAVGERQRQMRCNIVVLHLDASLVRAGLVRGVGDFDVQKGAKSAVARLCTVSTYR
jgi:hypothetical protein